MSRAIRCDQCGTTLVLDGRGDDEHGEIAGWIDLTIATTHADLCTRSCVIEFLNDPDIVAAHEAQMENIADIVRAIREGREEASGEPPVTG